MTNLIASIKCYFLGHKFYRVQKVSHNVDKVACSRCSKVWGVNHDLKVMLEWDEELSELYRVLGVREIQPWR